MPRTYRVQTFTYNNNADKHLRGRVAEYVVTDAEVGEDKQIRPDVAVFPVNALYDAESQLVRADRLVAYLNDVNSKIGLYQTLSSTSITS
jgi:hypothetical protein